MLKNTPYIHKSWNTNYEHFENVLYVYQITILSKKGPTNIRINTECSKRWGFRNVESTDVIFLVNSPIRTKPFTIVVE